MSLSNIPNAAKALVLGSAITAASIGGYEIHQSNNEIYLRTNKATQTVLDATQLMLDAETDFDGGTCIISRLGAPGFEVFDLKCGANNYTLSNTVIGDTQCCRDFKLRKVSPDGTEVTAGFDFEQDRTAQDLAATGKYGAAAPENHHAYKDLDGIFSVVAFPYTTDMYSAYCSVQRNSDDLPKCFIHPHGVDAPHSEDIQHTMPRSPINDAASAFFTLYNKVVLQTEQNLPE